MKSNKSCPIIISFKVKFGKIDIFFISIELIAEEKKGENKNMSSVA